MISGNARDPGCCSTKLARRFLRITTSTVRPRPLRLPGTLFPRADVVRASRSSASRRRCRIRLRIAFPGSSWCRTERRDDIVEGFAVMRPCHSRHQRAMHSRGVAPVSIPVVPRMPPCRLRRPRSPDRDGMAVHPEWRRTRFGGLGALRLTRQARADHDAFLDPRP